MTSPSRKRLAGLARVSALFAVIGAFSLTWWTHHAKAEVGSEGLRLGRQLAPIADLVEGGHAIVLNGQELHLAMTTVDHSVPEVLDRVAAHCRTNPGTLDDLWTDIDRAQRLPTPSDLAIVRDEEDGEGVVLCFSRNEQEPALDALRRFSATKDLGALGKLRYAYARPDGAGQTHVLTVLTEGTFRVDRILAEAEGTITEDTRLVPRPPNSRFVFDARIRETPFAVRVYRTKTSTSETARYYDAVMGRRGWDIVSPPVPGGETRGYVMDGVQVVVGATTDAASGDTLVAVAELGVSR